MHNDPLPLQLAGLYLGKNSLQGPLPDSWSECARVSHCQYTHMLACCGLAALNNLDTSQSTCSSSEQVFHGDSLVSYATLVPRALPRSES